MIRIAGLTLAALLAAAPAAAKVGSCDEPPIVWGTTISSSGVYSTLADRWREMTEIFADEVNKAGGVAVGSCGKKLPLKIAIYDDQSVPTTAVTLYEKMATVDNVDFFVGPDWSAFGGPVPPVAEKHQIPMVAANVAAEPLFRRGLKYFRANAIPVVANWNARYFDMLSEQNPRPQSIYFITQDNPVAKAITDVWSKKAEGMDVHVSIVSGTLRKQIGKDIEGVSGVLPWYPGIEGGDYVEFAERVLSRAKIDKIDKIDMFDYPYSMGRLGAYLIMWQAIEKAGAVDREKVREALHKGKFKSPIGEIEYDEGGYPFRNGAFPLQIQDAKVVIVWPPEQAGGKLQWPSPSWQ